MLSSSSSQDFLMKIARGADVSETIASGVKNVYYIFDGFREKKTESEDTEGWAIRRTEVHYEVPEGWFPDKPLSLLLPQVKPVKTIVKWANGNADLYHHIFSSYLDYDYEFDGRVPVPVNKTEIQSVTCEFPASNMPEQLNFRVVVKPYNKPTDVVLTCYNDKDEIVNQYPLWDNLTGAASVNVDQAVNDLTPGKYKAIVTATSQDGDVEHVEFFEVLPGIGRELTAYSVPFMVGKMVYIDPSAAVNGDGNSPETPLNSWNSVTSLGSEQNYLQKRGTVEVMPGSGFRNVVGACFIGAYGDESLARPKLQSAAGGNTFISTDFRITIKDMEISGPALSGTGVRIRGGANSVIYNCSIHNWEQCIATQPIGNTNANHWSGIKVLYTTIYNANLDGIYFDDTTGVEVGHCHFYNINMFCLVDPNEDNSVGDCIQAACAGIKLTLNVHHCTFDRTATFNKFCVIYGDSLQTAEGTFRYNHFKMPMDWANPSHPVTGIYVDYTRTAQVYEFNVFEGGNYGVYLRSLAGNAVFNYNVFNKNNIAINLGPALQSPTVNISNNLFSRYAVAGIYQTSVGYAKITNNLFMQSAVSAIMNYYSLMPASNYNHFYSTPIYGGLLLPAMQAGNKELNSTEGDPLFIDSNQYHPNYMPGAGSPLVGTGQMIAGVTKDFVGNTIETPNSKGLYDVPALTP